MQTNGQQARPREFAAADLGRALEEAEPGPNERQARLAFRASIVLGLFLPVIGLPVQWLLAAAVNLKREPGEGRRYGRYTIGLAIVDTLMGLSFTLAGFGVIPMPDGGASRPRIGVQLDVADNAPGALVALVEQGTPAEEGGLEAGDRILSVDGEPVASASRLISTVATSPEGEELALVVLRGEEELERVVVPRVLPVPEAEPRGLFEVGPAPPGPEAEGASGLLWIVGLFGVTILLAARRAGGALLVALLITLVQMIWVSSTVVGGMLPTMVFNGFTSGGMLIGMAAGALFGAVASWLAIRFLRFRGLLSPARRASFGRQLGTFFLGVFFLFAILPRSVGLALGLGGVLDAFGRPTAPFDPGEMFRSTGMPPEGIWLLLGVIVLLAPLYEELLFRGLFLPWLARGLGATAAIFASAFVFGAMHAHYGPYFLVTAGYGVALGWARIKSGGVLVPWLMHACVNFAVSWPLWWPLVAGE